jgi:hypothetical protein
LRRANDGGRAPRWSYVPAVLLMPAVVAVTFGVQRLAGVAVPDPWPAIGSVLVLSLGLFVGALAEELGWSGYATERMRNRWSGLTTGVLLGLFWAVYHYPALLHLDRPLSWIAWWTLYTVALRVVLTWLFDQSRRSVFVVTVLHMSANLGWQLYPVDGSFFDPRLTGVILAAVAAILVLPGRYASRRPRVTRGKAVPMP